jgi:hypothetical protein
MTKIEKNLTAKHKEEEEGCDKAIISSLLSNL